MFCSQCGQPIRQQAFCSACGAATGIGLTANNAVARIFSRVSRHVQTVGVLWLAYAGYVLLHWLLAITFMRSYFAGHAWFMGTPMGMSPFPFAANWGWLIPLITAILIVRSILSVIVGIALVTRQPWGRTFAIVMAVLTLIKPFTGTALAIYTLWVLWGPYAREEYSQIVAEGR